MTEFISLDLPPILCALFACISCALLGNFLLLRRLSLMGDAISHAVLPGIVISFLISGTRTGASVFIGAAIAGILTSVLVELVKSFGKLETGASMGVVFSIMFAIGVLLIEQAAARNVELDADCLLYGQLETIFWYPPKDASLFSLSTLSLLPSEVITSFMVFIASALFVVIFFKELAISSFDPALATSIGISAKGLHYLLMIVVAGAVVASFEAVGSILVIAMIICPAATARFYTDRLKVQISLSLLFAAISVIGGYVIAGFAPVWLGYENAVNAGGMMTVTSGFLLFTSALFAPEYGVVSKFARRLSLTIKVYKEDILAFLYRSEEKKGPGVPVSLDGVSVLFDNRYLWRRALSRLIANGNIIENSGKFCLTEKGRDGARSLVRSHRLWESFLVEQAGLQADHVHVSAEKLEHFTKDSISEKLAEEQSHISKDPHGKPIP